MYISEISYTECKSCCGYPHTRVINKYLQYICYKLTVLSSVHLNLIVKKNKKEFN